MLKRSTILFKKFKNVLCFVTRFKKVHYFINKVHYFAIFCHILSKRTPSIEVSATGLVNDMALQPLPVHSYVHACFTNSLKILMTLKITKFHLLCWHYASDAFAIL